MASNSKLVYIDECVNRLRFCTKGILDFKNLLKDLKKKHFAEVIIENEDIESIEDGDFNEISFDGVNVNYCPKLKRIHWNAFGMQSDQIKTFNAWNINDNSLPNLISETNTDYDLIKLINSLTNCEQIKMYSLNDELQPIKLHNLKIITIYGNNSSIKIKSINDFAFYECDKIEEIHLGWNNISFISENAFHFRNQNDKELIINLYCNNLNESSFALNSLSNFKRPTKLKLDSNQIIYLSEEVFKPFLDANQCNEIEIENTYFDVKNNKNQ